MAPTLKAVKEEPEEDDTQAMADPALVPPCVVLEKLEELLTKGRILLRYQPAGTETWGVNGKIEAEWRSFKVAANTVCQFVDDTVWTTDDREGWADGELETLGKLQQKALQIPATSAEQPSALKPRTCRRTVFKYHKAKYAEKRMAIAKAKAKAKADVEAAAKAKEEAEAAEKAKAAAEKAKADAEAAANAKADAIAAAQARAAAAKAKAKANREANAKAPAPQPVAKAKQPPAPAMTPSTFLAGAKARLLEAGQKDLYKKVLGAVSKNLAEADVVAMLVDFPDVAEDFKQLHRSTGSDQKSQSEAPAVETPKALPKPVPIPEVPAHRKPAVPAIDIEARFLRPIKERGGDAATHLVNLVFEKRRAPASLRLAALRYVRSHTTPEGLFRKLVIVRGPVACGKSKWAMEQLLLETVTLPEEEQVARSAHICAVDDFHTTFQAGGCTEEFKFNPDEATTAYAKNEARVKVAMEVGIQPLYVDSCNVQLWEMTPYVKLAKQFGYEVVFADPSEICPEWENYDALLERNGTEGRPAAKVSSKELIEASLVHFETLDEVGEEAEKLVLGCQPGVKKAGHKPRERPAMNGKRSLPPDSEPRKAAKSAESPTGIDTGAGAVSGAGAEGRIASSLLKSLIKKGS
jgi:hypothetical protein